MAQREENRDEFISVSGVSDLLKVSKAKAYNLLNEGALPFFDFGGVRRVARRDLEEFIEKSKR